MDSDAGYNHRDAIIHTASAFSVGLYFCQDKDKKSLQNMVRLGFQRFCRFSFVVQKNWLELHCFICNNLCCSANNNLRVIDMGINGEILIVYFF